MVSLNDIFADLLPGRRTDHHQIHREQWHYLVREWRRDGPDDYLAIVTNGQTDNINQAFALCNSSDRPRHIFDTRQNKIIHRSNY